MDFETGLLANDPQSFKRYWIKLAQDALLRNQFPEAGMKRSLGTPWESTVDAFEQIAAEAVSRSRTQPWMRGRRVKQWVWARAKTK